MTTKQNNIIFCLYLGTYLLIASLYATQTPAWQAPDEPAHYNYVRQLADGRFPIMQTSDYSQAYQSEVISSGFDAQYDLKPFSYEDYQPPLYYLVQTPVFWLSNGSLIAMRLFGVFLGSLTLIMAHKVWQLLFPQRPWLGFTALAFFAFLPQHIAIQASMNNDSLSELLIATALWLALQQPFSRYRKVLTAVLGLALLTKVTTYLIFPPIGLIIVYQHWGDIRRTWREGLQTFIPALLVGALWWGRNLAIYGWPDLLGIDVHDAVVVGQPTTAEWIAQFGFNDVVFRFVQTSFRSFWGQFGWMGVVMPTWVYQTLALFSILVLVGWVISFVRPQKQPDPANKLSNEAKIAFIALFSLNLALYLVYNLTYVQHQGRYLFAALIPISTAVSFGIHTYLNLLPQKPLWLSHITPHLFALALVGLDLLALYRFIIPALT